MVSAIPIPSRPTSVSVRCDPHFQGNAPVSCTKDRKKKKTPAHHCKRKKKEMQDGLAKKNDNAGLHKVVCVYVGDIPRRNAVQCFCPIWSGRQANAPPPPPQSLTCSHRCNIATLPWVLCVCFSFLALSDCSSASVLSLSNLH